MTVKAVGIGELGSDRGEGLGFERKGDRFSCVRTLTHGDAAGIERGLAALGSFGEDFDLPVDFGGPLGVQHLYVRIPPALPGYAVASVGYWQDPDSFFGLVDASLRDGYPGGEWIDSPLEDPDLVGMARYELAGLLMAADPVKWSELAAEQGGPVPGGSAG